MPSKKELAQIVSDSLVSAQEALGTMRLDEQVRVKVAKAMLSQARIMQALKLGSAVNVWTASLFVDMRSSTTRALELGARKTYLTMHALLPALTHLVAANSGFVVGFRGDGLFAAFGLDSNGNNPLPLNKGDFLRSAATCGKQMVEAVDSVVNPALEDVGVEAIDGIGIGIDEGEVVITRIGLGSAFDITAYGNSVNNASKLCADSFNQILLSQNANSLYPSSIGGMVKATAHDGKRNGVVLNFPHMLS
jgi:class 3 adenylate cyclase